MVRYLGGPNVATILAQFEGGNLLFVSSLTSQHLPKLFLRVQFKVLDVLYRFKFRVNTFMCSSYLT